MKNLIQTVFSFKLLETETDSTITGFAGLPGFIVGMSVGPLLAHTYYVFELPDRRAEAFAQSIRFSVGLAVFVAAALLSLRYTANHASAVTLGVLTASWAIVPCAVVLMIVGRRLFGRRPKWDQSVAVQEQPMNRSRLNAPDE